MAAGPVNTGVPAYNAAIRNAAEFLKGDIQIGRDGHLSLVAYALLKAGVPATNSTVQNAISSTQSRVKNGKFDGRAGSFDIYLAAIDAMLLVAASPEQYTAEVATIADFIVRNQMQNGSWDYGGQDVTGDTSIAQYAALALWAASQSGYEVPTRVWDAMAAWHFRSQINDGGFPYKPNNGRYGGAGSDLNMTGNAVSTLSIIRLQLYPSGANPFAKKKSTKPEKKFGILEARTEPEPEEEKKKPVRSKPATSLSALNASIQRGLGFMANRYVPIRKGHGHTIYYNYALERACALNNLENLGSHAWYRTSGDELLKMQKPDGAFNGSAKEDINDATAFAILFYVRATKAAVVAQFGAGLMRGGRDFDLDNSEMGTDGQVKKKRKITDPLDKLLTSLSDQDPEELFAAQQAIVEKVQLGDRKELLGQIDRIRKLITNDNAEIRRTAVWALGRSGDLRDAYLLINALEDTDVDVLVEAYNALSYLSRKISGVGLSANPLADLEETNPNPTQAQIDATVDRWRREALKRWSAWYFRVRPYDERNDLFELRFGAAIGNTRGSSQKNR